MTDPNRYKDLYNFDDQISFQRRQCEATEKVAEKIGNLTFWVALIGFSIVGAIYITGAL